MATVVKRQDLERGLEPDECYWIANEAKVSETVEIDFEHDPPPDLAVEIEISRSALNRQNIYAVLGVPEIWRFDGERLRVCLRKRSGKYVESKASAAFPFLPVQELVQFLRTDEPLNETARLRQFVEWIRSQNFDH
jgi:Uma2 family endonuclease